MQNDYGSRKKKADQTQSDWPSEIKFRPTENKDISHAYEYVSGVNNLITYYGSTQNNFQFCNQGTWTQRFQNFEKQKMPKTFEKLYHSKKSKDKQKTQKSTSNQINFEEKGENDMQKFNKKHDQYTLSIRNMIKSEDFSFHQTKTNLNIFDRKNFTMNKIIEKVNNSKFKKLDLNASRKLLPQLSLKIQTTRSEVKSQELKNIKSKQQTQSLIKNQKSDVVKIKKNQDKQKQKAQNIQMLQNQTELNDDNVFNYQKYFQKKYQNHGLKLQLSDKTKLKIEEFENRIKSYCNILN